MVRLVFRPYTQVWRTICTSVPLRASTRISPGFTLLKHSSPSFGSNQICSYSRVSQKINGGWCCRLLHLGTLYSLSFRLWVYHPQTRICDWLLGPCFKTVVRKPFRQDRKSPSCSSVRKYAATFDGRQRTFQQRRTWSCLQQGEALPRLQLQVLLRKPSTFAFVKHHLHWPASLPSFSTISSLLTLFSKFCSSFLHSTCSLSVSHPYLVLDEVYHPIKAAIPSYPTLWSSLSPSQATNTGVSPSLPYCSK